MIGLTPTASGDVKLSSEPLGKGGEGSVYAVLSHSIPGIPPAEKLVAKIYHSPEEENRRAKLKTMVTSPVSDKAVAWPQALVFDAQKQFQGYLMVKLEKMSNREWLYLANTKERNKNAPDFDTRYAFMAVRNLAAAILAVHAAGHLVGDINESNVFVKANASVLIVDSDSMQIKDSQGIIYPCVVGKQEYTAPELSYGSFRDNLRTPETDIFAFAVASFQLLTGGATPHQGAFDPNSSDDPLSTVERIRKGILPGLAPVAAKKFGFSPRPGVPVEAFPSFLKEHFLAFLSPDVAARQTSSHSLEILIKDIDAYAPALVRCAKEKLHWHKANEVCSWCLQASLTGIDPWGTVAVKNAPAQMSLPAIGFNDGSAPTAAPRATPAVAGQQAHQANQQASGAPLDPLTQLLSSNPAFLQAAVAAHAALTGAPAAGAATAASVRPKKIKGKVTVEYADGSWGMRPPLSRMLRQSPKLFLWAVKEETWGVFKFWWPVERNVANPAALITGAVIALAFVYTNFILALNLLTTYIPEANGSVRFWIAAVPTATSLITSIWLMISAFRDRSTVKKNNHGKLTGFKQESMLLTIARFVPIVIFYGVPAVIIGIVGAVFTLLKGIIKA